MLKISAIIFSIFINYNLFGQSYEGLIKNALKAEKEKKHIEAIDFYQGALKIDKNNYFIYNKIGLNYYYLGKLDSSISYYNLTLKIKPNDSAALYQRGHCYLDLNQFQNALDDFQKSFEATNRKNSDAAFNIGKSYSGLRNYEKAIEYYKITLDLEPNDKYAFYELGYNYASLANPDKNNALKYYNKAIEQDKNYYDAYFNRGLLYGTQFKNLKKAHADLEKSIEIRPKNQLSYLYNGMFYRDENEFDKAKDMYNKVIEFYPDFADAYFERAVAWYGIGVLNMTCKDLDKAASLGHKQAADLKKSTCK